MESALLDDTRILQGLCAVAIFPTRGQFLEKS